MISGWVSLPGLLEGTKSFVWAPEVKLVVENPHGTAVYVGSSGAALTALTGEEVVDILDAAVTAADREDRDAERRDRRGF